MNDRPRPGAKCPIKRGETHHQSRAPYSNVDKDAVQIGELYRKARLSVKESVEYLVDAGHRLLAKKNEVGHGNWLPWLEANADVLGFGISTASKLMKAATKFVASYEYGEDEALAISREIWGHTGRGIVTGVGMHPYAERGEDLYETPSGAALALLDGESFDGTIWEPANGRSAISRVLREAGHRVVATDLIDHGCPDATGGVDFLARTAAPEGVTTILTNPPFMYADEFVRHALTLAPRVVFLLRLAFVAGVGRSDILDSGKLARIHVFANRLNWDGLRTSSAMEMAWFVWDRGHHGPIELQRISWEPDGDEAV